MTTNPNKKKIVVFHPNLVIGGAERMIVNIVNGLNPQHFDITLALGEKKGVFLEHINSSINIEDVEITRLRLAGLIKLYFYFKNKNPDIILGNWTRYNAGLCMIKFFLSRNIKLVIRETGVPGVPSFKIRRSILLLYRLFINQSTIVVAQSKDMYEGIINVYGAKMNKLRIIQNAVNVDMILKQAKLESSLVANKINLLAVGRFSFTMQKGFDLLLKTFSQLPERNRYHLTFLGDGEMLAEHKLLARELVIERNVTFFGFCANPYPFLREADVLISSSKHEGFPNVVLEALVCGTPVLANNYKGGINEIIQEGKNGAICDITDVSDVYEKLKLVIKLKSHSKDISQEAIKKWDKHKITEEYNKMLLEI